MSMCVYLVSNCMSLGGKLGSFPILSILFVEADSINSPDFDLAMVIRLRDLSAAASKVVGLKVCCQAKHVGFKAPSEHLGDRFKRKYMFTHRKQIHAKKARKSVG